MKILTVLTPTTGKASLWHVGDGLQGNCYAIPIYDEDMVLLPIDQIKPYIEKFVYFTKMHDRVKFFITRLGYNTDEVADQAIAKLFYGVENNCNMPVQWKEWVR